MLIVSVPLGIAIEFTDVPAVLALVWALLFVVGILGLSVSAFRQKRRESRPIRASLWAAMRSAGRLIFDFMP